MQLLTPAIAIISTASRALQKAIAFQKNSRVVNWTSIKLKKFYNPSNYAHDYNVLGKYLVNKKVALYNPRIGFNTSVTRK